LHRPVNFVRGDKDVVLLLRRILRSMSLQLHAFAALFRGHTRIRPNKPKSITMKVQSSIDQTLATTPNCGLHSIPAATVVCPAWSRMCRTINQFAFGYRPQIVPQPSKFSTRH